MPTAESEGASSPGGGEAGSSGNGGARRDAGRSTDDGSTTKQQRRLAVWDTRAKIATALMPLVVAGVGYFVTRSITSIEVAPQFINLAMAIIEQDPRHQPEGVREWAVGLLVEYSKVELDSDLVRRLEDGWGFSVPAEKIGTFSYAARQTNTPIIDGHRFELRFEVSGGDAGRLEGLTLSLPANDKTVSRDHLSTTGLLRIHAGPVAYLFQLDAVEDPVARFTVWKQSPSLRPLDVEGPGELRTREGQAGAGSLGSPE